METLIQLLPSSKLSMWLFLLESVSVTIRKHNQLSVGRLWTARVYEYDVAKVHSKINRYP